MVLSVQAAHIKTRAGLRGIFIVTRQVQIFPVGGLQLRNHCQQRLVLLIGEILGKAVI